MKYQITLLGTSNLFGRVASSLLRRSPSVKKLKLYDDLDVVHASESGSSCQVHWLNGKQQLTTALQGSDIIVIGDECKVVKDNEKDSLVAAASKVVDYSFAIAHTVPKAMVVVAASPLNIMVPLMGHVLKQLGCYDGRKVLGMTSIDTLRANALYSNYVNQADAILPVVGGVSPQTRVPIFSQAKPTVSIPQDDQHRMIEEIKSFDLRIHDEDEKTSAIERAYATVRLVHSVISGLLEEPYAAEMALAKTSLIPEVSYFSLPVDLGKSGIERTFGLPQLSPLELEMMDYAVINLNNDLMKAHDLYSTFKPCLDMFKNITYSSVSSKKVGGPVNNDAGQLETGLNHRHRGKKEKPIRRKGIANRKSKSKKRSKLPILHCPAPDVVADIEKSERFGKIERAHKKLVINQILPHSKQTELPELRCTKASKTDLKIILDKTKNDSIPLFKINKYTDDNKTNSKTNTKDRSISSNAFEKNEIKPQVSYNKKVDNIMDSEKKYSPGSIVDQRRCKDDNNVMNNDKKCFKNTINYNQSSMDEKNDAFPDSKKELRLKSKCEITKSQSEKIITTAKDVLKIKEISYKKTPSNAKQEIKRIVKDNEENKKQGIVKTSVISNNAIKECKMNEELNLKNNFNNERDVEIGPKEKKIRKKKPIFISRNSNAIEECSQIEGIETNSKNEKDNNRELVNREQKELGNIKDSAIFNNNNVTKGIKKKIESTQESEERLSIQISSDKNTEIDINKYFITKKHDQRDMNRKNYSQFDNINQSDKINGDRPLSADKVSKEVMNTAKEIIGKHKKDFVINNGISVQQYDRENICKGNSKNESESSQEIGISEEIETNTRKTLATGENKINYESIIKSDNISVSDENDKAIIDKGNSFAVVSEQEDKIKQANVVKTIDSIKKEEERIDKNKLIVNNFKVFAEKTAKEIVPKGVLGNVVDTNINELSESQNEEFERKNFAKEKLEEIERPLKETKKELHTLKTMNNIDPKEQGNIIGEIIKQSLRASFNKTKDDSKHKKNDESENIQLAQNIKTFNYQPALSENSKNITNIDDILQDFVKGGCAPKSKDVLESELTKQAKNIYKQDNVYISHGCCSKDKVGQISESLVKNQVVDSTSDGIKTTIKVQTLSANSSIDSQPLNDKRTDLKNDQTNMQPNSDFLLEKNRKLTVESLPILIKNAKTVEDNNFHKDLWLKNKTQSKRIESSPINVNLDKVLEEKNVSVSPCNILESFTQKGIKKNNATNYKTDGSKPLTYTVQTKSKKDEISKRYTILKKGQICSMVKEDINANQIKAKLYKNVHVDSLKTNIPRSFSENDMLAQLKQTKSNALRLKNTSFLKLMVNSGSKGAPTLSDGSDSIGIRGSHNVSSIHESTNVTNQQDRKLINQQLAKKAKDQLNMTKVKNCKKAFGGHNGSFPIVSNDFTDDKDVKKNNLATHSSETTIEQLKNRLQILKEKYRYKKSNKSICNSYTVSVEKKEFCHLTKNKKAGMDFTYVNDKNRLPIPTDKNKSEQKTGSDMIIKEGNKKDTLLSSCENPIRENTHNVIEKKSIESDISMINDKIDSSIGTDLKNSKSQEINLALANSESINSTQIGEKQLDSLLTLSAVADSASKVSQLANKLIYSEKTNVVHDAKFTTIESSSSEMEKNLQTSAKNIEGKYNLPKETTKPNEEFNVNDKTIKTLCYPNSKTNKKVFNSSISEKYSFASPHKKSIRSFLDFSVKETKNNSDNSLGKLLQEKNALYKSKQIPSKKSIEPIALKIFATGSSSKNLMKKKAGHESPNGNPVNHKCDKTLLPDAKLELRVINSLLPKPSSTTSLLLDPNCDSKNITRKNILPSSLQAVKPFKNLNADSPKLKNNSYARWTPQSLMNNKHNRNTNLERDENKQKELSQKNPFINGKISMTTNLFKEYMRKNRNNDYTNSTTDADRSFMRNKVSPLALDLPQNIKEHRLALSGLKAEPDDKKTVKNDEIFSKLSTNKPNMRHNILPQSNSPSFPKTAIGQKVTGTSQISTSNLVSGKNTIKIQTQKTHSVYKPYNFSKTQNNIYNQKINNNFKTFSNPPNMTLHGKHKEKETKRMHLLKAFKDQENTENKFEELQKVLKQPKQLNLENSMIKHSTTFTKNLNAKKPADNQNKKMHLLKAYSQESLNNKMLENEPILLRPLSAPPEYHPSFPLSKPKKQEKEKKKNYSEPSLKKRWTQLLDIFQSVIKNEKKNWVKDVPAQHLLFTEDPSHTKDNLKSLSEESSGSNSQRKQSSAKRVHSYQSKMQPLHGYKPSHGD